MDEVLNQGVQGVSDLITLPGLINLDFADLRSVMENAGSSLMGIGYGSGENRAVEAARAAIDSPLLELSIEGAKGLVFNITGGTDLSMYEVEEAAKIITDSAAPDANIIFGATINETYTGDIKITVVATGFDEESNRKHMETRSSVSTSAFGKKALGGSPRHTPVRPVNPATSGQSAASADDTDYDVPAFLRNRGK